MEVARQKTLDEFPKKGTALLCASGPKEPAKAPTNQQYTMFSGALLDVLNNGLVEGDEWFSLSEIGQMVCDRIRSLHHDDAVRPQVLSPEQKEGDISSLPLFPNTAFKNEKAFNSEEEIDSLFSGGFRRDDHLLNDLLYKPTSSKTRYELCRELIESDKNLFSSVDKSFKELAEITFEKHLADQSDIDLRDAKTALFVANELAFRYAAFGQQILNENKSNRIKKETCHIDIPEYFERIYPNTVNVFLKDIISLNNHTGQHKQIPRETDIAIAAKYIVTCAIDNLSRNKVNNQETVGPEIHAVYILGRVKNSAAKKGVVKLLENFETDLNKKLKNFSENDDNARQYYLMRRTSLISQAMLGDKAAVIRYLGLLLHNFLESDTNAGFHLEYYLDQNLDGRLTLCSEDMGGVCENTVKHLSTSVMQNRPQDGGSISNPLAMIEIYTLCSIIVKRINSDLKSSLDIAIKVLKDIRINIDGDLRAYVDLCLECYSADSSSNYAAKMIGNYLSAKNAPRNGWLNRKVQYPETVGSHTASTIWLCNLISKEDSNRYDIDRIKKMLEVHDIAEGITGDIVSPEKNEENDKIERDLMLRLSWLGNYLEPQVNLYHFYALYQEFSEHQTEESKIAHDIDLIDIVLQGRAILQSKADCDLDKINTLIQKTTNKISHPAGKNILALVSQMNVISEGAFAVTQNDAEIKRYFFGL